MQNPVLTNRNYAFIYFSAWGIIAVIHFFLALFFSPYGVLPCLMEALFASALFAVLGIGIWYPVYFTDPQKNRIINFLTNHLASCSLAVSLWLWLTQIVGNIIYADLEGYQKMHENTLGWAIAIGMLYYFIVSLSYYLVIYYEAFQEKIVKENELKALVKESELASLKSQINPHFLFNSLNSISSLTMFSPERAQEMVISLSEFLRYSLSQKKETLTTFENELRNIDRYLKIEKTRFGKRLHVDQDISEDCKQYKLPGLILQPIMENAIKYGVYESTDKSNIQITGTCKPNLLTVEIKNEYDPDFLSKKGEGIGLRNVKSRMEILYSRKDLLTIKNDNKTFEVTMRFPQN